VCYISEENVVYTHTYNYLFSLSNCFLIRIDESIIHMSADWWLIYVSYIIAQRLLYTFIVTAIWQLLLLKCLMSLWLIRLFKKEWRRKFKIFSTLNRETWNAYLESGSKDISGITLIYPHLLIAWYQCSNKSGRNWRFYTVIVAPCRPS
jgi:hypothetical protein